MEYQNIDISTWTQVGEGGNGKTYVHPGHPELLVCSIWCAWGMVTVSL